jgi:hypothetical protein
MRYGNSLLLGSFALVSMLGIEVGEAQSSPSVPAQIAGGHAEFTPAIQIPTSGTTGAGSPTDDTLAFPLPAIPGYPGISIVAKSPAFVAHGSFFFPLSDSSRPERTGEFILEGEVEYSIPQQKIFILFSNFRVDTAGNVFARFRLNGQEIGGSEIELLNAAPGTAPTTNKNKFIISAKELISTPFADAINKLFNTTVLAPGQELATLNLVARVAQ